MFNYPKHNVNIMFKLMVFWDVVDRYRHLEEPHSCIFHVEDGCNSFLQSDGTCLPNCIVLHDLRISNRSFVFTCRLHSECITFYLQPLEQSESDRHDGSTTESAEWLPCYCRTAASRGWMGAPERQEVRKFCITWASAQSESTDGHVRTGKHHMTWKFFSVSLYRVLVGCNISSRSQN